MMRTIIINFQERSPIVRSMRWDRLTFTALGGIAALLVGIALLLEDERMPFAPVFVMVGGIAALVLANHERLKLRVDALEQRLVAFLSSHPNLLVKKLRLFVRAVRRYDCCEDFAIIRWYLDCEKTTFSTAHHVEGYAHAVRERFGVMAGSLLGHEAGSSLH